MIEYESGGGTGGDIFWVFHELFFECIEGSGGGYGGCVAEGIVDEALLFLRQ